MPGKLLTNVSAPGYGPLPGAGWTTPVPPLNEQVVLECVNTSGGALAHGDVVVVDTGSTANATTGWIPMPAIASPPISPQGAGVAVTTTTSANSKTVLGVVTETGDASTNAGSTAAGGALWVCIAGVARVQIGAQTVNAGDSLFTAAVAKTAVSQTNAAVAAAVATFFGAAFGVALEANTAKDANNTVRAIIGKSA